MLSWFASLSVVNQAALWGLIGIAIPVLIHIINPSKGKLVWVGNIELIKKAKQTRVNQLKIKHWLLLLVRLLIIILCCLLVAGLWNSSSGQGGKEFKLLITPSWLTNASEQDKQELIDEHPDAELFVLDNNNSTIDSAALFDKAFISSINASNELSYAELAEKARTLKLSPSHSVLAITNHYASLEAPRELNAFFNQIYTSEVAASMVQGVVSVLIISDDVRINDVKIISRSFSVLPDVIKEKFKVESVSYSRLNEEPQRTGYDVVFSLTNEETDVEQYVNQNGLLILDSNLGVSPNSRVAELLQLNEQPFQFQISQSNQQALPVWRSSTGKDILSYQKRRGIHQLYFASRFHPQWTDLVESSQFPIILVDLIQNYLSGKRWNLSSSSFDINRQSSKSERTTSRGVRRKENLYSWILLLFACFWLIERTLAEKNSFQVKKEDK